MSRSDISTQENRKNYRILACNSAFDEIDKYKSQLLELNSDTKTLGEFFAYQVLKRYHPDILSEVDEQFFEYLIGSPSHLSDELLKLATNTAQGLSCEDFLDLLIKSKKFNISRENANLFSYWNQSEISILSEVGFFVPVDIYDSGRPGDLVVSDFYNRALSGSLIYVPTSIFSVNYEIDGDSSTISAEVGEGKNIIDQSKFNEFCKNRLLPFLIQVNQDAAAKDKNAFVSISELEFEFIDSDFDRSLLSSNLREGLVFVLQLYSEQLGNIANIRYVSPFFRGRDIGNTKFENVNFSTCGGNNLYFAMDANSNSAMEFYSFLGSKALSWPCSASYIEGRMLPEFSALSSTNVLSKFTGVDGSYICENAPYSVFHTRFDCDNLDSWFKAVVDQKVSLKSQNGIFSVRGNSVKKLSGDDFGKVDDYQILGTARNELEFAALSNNNKNYNNFLYLRGIIPRVDYLTGDNVLEDSCYVRFMSRESAVSFFNFYRDAYKIFSDVSQNDVIFSIDINGEILRDCDGSHVQKHQNSEEFGMAISGSDVDIIRDRNNQISQNKKRFSDIAADIGISGRITASELGSYDLYFDVSNGRRNAVIKAIDFVIRFYRSGVSVDDADDPFLKAKIRYLNGEEVSFGVLDRIRDINRSQIATVRVSINEAQLNDFFQNYQKDFYSIQEAVINSVGSFSISDDSGLVQYSAAEIQGERPSQQDAMMLSNTIINNPRTLLKCLNRTLVRDAQRNMESVGTTASMYYLDFNGGNPNLTVSNIGDSRVYLAFKDKNNGVWKTILLTEDHKPGVDCFERTREHVEKNGGLIITDSNGVRRVSNNNKSGLAMSASIGDCDYSFLMRVPDIAAYNISKILQDIIGDDFVSLSNYDFAVINACDGLTDGKSDDNVDYKVSFVRNNLDFDSEEQAFKIVESTPDVSFESLSKKLDRYDVHLQKFNIDSTKSSELAAFLMVDAFGDDASDDVNSADNISINCCVMDGNQLSQCDNNIFSAIFDGHGSRKWGHTVAEKCLDKTSELIEAINSLGGDSVHFEVQENVIDYLSNRNTRDFDIDDLPSVEEFQVGVDSVALELIPTTSHGGIGVNADIVDSYTRIDNDGSEIQVEEKGIAILGVDSENVDRFEVLNTNSGEFESGYKLISGKVIIAFYVDDERITINDIFERNDDREGAMNEILQYFRQGEVIKFDLNDGSTVMRSSNLENSKKIFIPVMENENIVWKSFSEALENNTQQARDQIMDSIALGTKLIQTNSLQSSELQIDLEDSQYLMPDGSPKKSEVEPVEATSNLKASNTPSTRPLAPTHASLFDNSSSSIILNAA